MTAAHRSRLPCCCLFWYYMGYLARTSLPTAILLIRSPPRGSNRSHGNDLSLQKLRCFGACEHYFPLPSQNKPKETKMIRNKLENKQELLFRQLLDSLQQ